MDKDYVEPKSAWRMTDDLSWQNPIAVGNDEGLIFEYYTTYEGEGDGSGIYNLVATVKSSVNILNLDSAASN